MTTACLAAFRSFWLINSVHFGGEVVYICINVGEDTVDDSGSFLRDGVTKTVPRQ